MINNTSNSSPMIEIHNVAQSLPYSCDRMPNPFYTSSSTFLESSMKEGKDKNSWKIISSPDQALLSRSIPTEMMSNPLLRQISNIRKESLAVISKAPTERALISFHTTANKITEKDPDNFFVKSDTLYEKQKCCCLIF